MPPLTPSAGRKYKPADVPTLNQLFSLAGRVAIVTGGSRGLGQEMAEGLAEAGASLMLCARREEWLTPAVETMRGQGFRVEGALCDVARPADVQAVVDKTVATFGKIDILVNNAGTSATSPFEKLTDEFLQHDFDQKLFAAIRLTRLVWPQMKERRWGRIINVLNIGAKAPRGGSAPTSITRAAGMAMTKALSQEFAPHNVLVNAMLVGLIEADQHVQRAKQNNVPLDEYYQKAQKELPLGRVGKAEEFANLACFLASDAGSYITGTATNVDGGRSPVV